MGPLRRFFLWFASLAALALPASATWSVVAIDRSTGEVCVATATCISGFNIRRWVPVIVVGKGGAAAQSAADGSGQNRLLIRDMLLADASPEEILDALSMAVAHQSRQYGIAGLGGPPVTFTGMGNNAAALGVAGRWGSIEYAIQGNVLTGPPVIEEAQAAFISTKGDLTQRVMAAMQAARFMGGDGRCSCDNLAPTSCGSPPPVFEKSAHAATILCARLGDTDGPCNTIDGCAAGSYYLARNVIQPASEPDPMIELARKYNRWRERKAGVPDHYLTRVEASAPRLPADGLTTSEVVISLVDLEEIGLTVGGQTIAIESVGDPVATAGVVTDAGDGSHNFQVLAGTTPGVARFRITVTQENNVVQLFPDLEIHVDEAADLHLGYAAVSATQGADVPVTLRRDANAAGRAYLVLCSASGTQPGTPFGGVIVPLNEDRLLRWSLGGSPLFDASQGFLDASGAAQALLQASPGWLNPFVGGRIDFCAVFGSDPYEISIVNGIDVLP